MKTILYHNQNCSKSCAALEKMNELTSDFEIINYLENVPTKTALKQLLAQLQLPAEALIRKTESVFIENFSNQELSENEWIDAMIKFPILIERPIIVHGNEAVIGRPIQRVIDLITKR